MHAQAKTTLELDEEKELKNRFKHTQTCRNHELFVTNIKVIT